MSFKIQNDLRSFLAAELKADIPEFSVELCPEGFDGDVTISCFPLAKAFRTNPMALAAKAGDCGAMNAGEPGITSSSRMATEMMQPHSAVDGRIRLVSFGSPYFFSRMYAPAQVKK